MKKSKEKYEWIGDAEYTIKAQDNEHSKNYYESNRDYDTEYRPSKDDIKTFP